MKHAYLLGVVMLAAACSGEGKKAPPPAPAASDREIVPARRVASPEEQAAALQRAQEAMAAVTAEAQRAAAEAAQTARAEAIEQARTAGVLGAAALTQGGTFAALTGTGDISSGFDDADVIGGLIGNTTDDPPTGFGGLGTRGSGVGGGGVGQGTIGLGTYGTLGHGSGTGPAPTDSYGDGRGGLRRSAGHVPQVKIGSPTCDGELDVALVRRYVKRQAAKLSYCYEKALLAQPALAGNVAAKFTIASDGTVTAATANGVSGEVAECMADVLHAIEFPHPASGVVVCSQSFTTTP